MSSYTNKTLIVFLDLPLGIRNKIDVIRKKYSTGGHHKWYSHITFKQDEDFLSSDSDMVQKIRDFFKNIKSFKLNILGPKIRVINDNWNIYIAISNDDYLKECIKSFSQSVEKFIDSESPQAFNSTKWEQGSDFYPHISLKGGCGIEDGKKMFSLISKEKFEIDFPASIICDSVTLARWQENHWHGIEQVKLQTEKFNK